MERSIADWLGGSAVASTLGVLWCYLCNPLFQQPEADCHTVADLIKRKLPETNGGHAGRNGLIMGPKAFQKPRHEGIALIQDVQDVYLDPAITIA